MNSPYDIVPLGIINEMKGFFPYVVFNYFTLDDDNDKSEFVTTKRIETVRAHFDFHISVMPGKDKLILYTRYSERHSAEFVHMFVERFRDNIVVAIKDLKKR